MAEQGWQVVGSSRGRLVTCQWSPGIGLEGLGGGMMSARMQVALGEVVARAEPLGLTATGPWFMPSLEEREAAYVTALAACDQVSEEETTPVAQVVQVEAEPEGVVYYGWAV